MNKKLVIFLLIFQIVCFGHFANLANDCWGQVKSLIFIDSLEFVRLSEMYKQETYFYLIVSAVSFGFACINFKKLTNP